MIQVVAKCSHDWEAHPKFTLLVGTLLSKHFRDMFVCESGLLVLAAFSVPLELFASHCLKELLLNSHNKTFMVKYRDGK